MKTAVEWLSEHINDCYYEEFIEQAKKKEKKQIINAVEKTIKSIKLTKDKTGFFVMSGEGYYNKTFKSE